MNPILKESIGQILNTIHKVNENTTEFINTFDLCSDPDEKDLITLLNLTRSFNNLILLINNRLELNKSTLIDSIYINDPDTEEHLKIKFNKPPGISSVVCESEAADLSLEINDKSKTHAALSIAIGAMLIVGVEKLDPDNSNITRLLDMANQLRDEIDQLNLKLSGL